MTYLVITVTELEADSVNDAGERALALQMAIGFEQFVHVKTHLTEAAVESALLGAELAVY